MSGACTVRVKFMLWLSAKAGKAEELIEISGETTIGGGLEIVIAKFPRLAPLIRDILEGRGELIVLHNGRTPAFGLSTPIRCGDELILMPPVSGG